MSKKAQTPPKSFEEAVKELEGILGVLEQGEVALEESLIKYERGTFLLQYCQQVLNEAEKRIELVSRGEDGSPVTQTLPEAAE